MKSKLAASVSAAPTPGRPGTATVVSPLKSPFHVPVSGAGMDPYGVEIKRILRRQEIARIGFVAACVGACALVTMAIWHLLDS